MVFATDSGGDEERNKQNIAKETSNDENLFSINTPCIMHQYHLMIQRSLKFSDEICRALSPGQNQMRRYFSTLAEILHCWRDHFRAISNQWRLEYGISDARAYTKQRPPRAISGRWCAVTAGEKYLLAPPMHQLQAIYPQIVAPKVATAVSQGTLRPLGWGRGPPLLALEDQPGEAAGSAKAAPKAKTAKSKAKSANPQEKQEALVDGTVELSLEETKAYTERQGKWRTDSALAVCDNIFVSVIADLCYRSHEPLHHFFHWLQAPTQPREIDGDLRHPTKLADIVYFKAEEIRADLESLTESRRWVSTLGKVDPELRRPLSECILTLTLLHLADFDTRIVHTFLDLDPIRLLTFSKRGAHIRDQGRVTLAEELPDTRPEKLQVTARKFVKMFRPELRSVVASGGVCPRTLWTQTAIWSETLPSDTQWIEGIK